MTAMMAQISIRLEAHAGREGYWAQNSKAGMADTMTVHAEVD